MDFTTLMGTNLHPCLIPVSNRVGKLSSPGQIVTLCYVSVSEVGYEGPFTFIGYVV